MHQPSGRAAPAAAASVPKTGLIYSVEPTLPVSSDNGGGGGETTLEQLPAECLYHILLLLAQQDVVYLKLCSSRMRATISRSCQHWFPKVESWCGTDPTGAGLLQQLRSAGGRQLQPPEAAIACLQHGPDLKIGLPARAAVQAATTANVTTNTTSSGGSGRTSTHVHQQQQQQDKAAMQEAEPGAGGILAARGRPVPTAAKAPHQPQRQPLVAAVTSGRRAADSCRTTLSSHPLETVSVTDR